VVAPAPPVHASEGKGKSLFVSSQSPTSSTLLRVDLQGHAHASLGPTRGVANLGDHCAERPRTSHPGYDKRQQCLDNREFLIIDWQPTGNVSVHGRAAVSI